MLLGNVDNEFYFGIGGIGDFLLLMSTFYDDCEQDQYDVVFVCNDMNTIRKISKLFPKIRRYWFFTKSAFYCDEGLWDRISLYKLCMGTGVTPKNFDYVKDWIECGKSNVFDYYGVNKHPKWVEQMVSHPADKPLVVIQPFGGANDPTKRKCISQIDLVEEIIGYESNGFEVILLGSEKDKTRYLGLHDMNWVVDFFDSWAAILIADYFIGCDSWGKTLAGLAGVPTRIYPNQYSAQLEDIFGHHTDPSDYVFLKDWGFKFSDGREV